MFLGENTEVGYSTALICRLEKLINKLCVIAFLQLVDYHLQMKRLLSKALGHLELFEGFYCYLLLRKTDKLHPFLRLFFFSSTIFSFLGCFTVQ